MRKSIFLLLSIFVFIFVVANLVVDKYDTVATLNNNINSTHDNSSKYKDYANPNSIISVEALNQLIDDNGIKVIAVISDKKLDNYIPSTNIINISDITTTKNEIEGFIADKDQIEKVLSNIGISNDDTIVVYDNLNGVFAARLWWTLKVYGHESIKILDGGLNEWEAKGYVTQPNPSLPSKSNYIAKNKNENMIASITQVLDSIDNNIIIDVRSKEEFKKGHIPSALSIEWTNALNNGKFKTKDQLLNIYEGIDKNDEILVYCLKAYRASHTYFVLSELLGYENIKVYDGSWSEYSISGNPIEK